MIRYCVNNLGGGACTIVVGRSIGMIYPLIKRGGGAEYQSKPNQPSGGPSGRITKKMGSNLKTLKMVPTADMSDARL